MLLTFCAIVFLGYGYVVKIFYDEKWYIRSFLGALVMIVIVVLMVIIYKRGY